MRYYIASRLENIEAVRDLKGKMNNQFPEWELTYDWTVHGPVWTHGRDKCVKVAHNELSGVRRADILIVLLPGGRGTHIEIGAALATDTPIVLVTSDPKDVAMNANLCAFYTHSSVNPVVPENLIEFLKGFENHG